jgi:hypothetical protein
MGESSGWSHRAIIQKPLRRKTLQLILTVGQPGLQSYSSATRRQFADVRVCSHMYLWRAARFDRVVLASTASR